MSAKPCKAVIGLMDASGFIKRATQKADRDSVNYDPEAAVSLLEMTKVSIEKVLADLNRKTSAKP
jgi:hypothetical protein